LSCLHKKKTKIEETDNRSFLIKTPQNKINEKLSFFGHVWTKERQKIERTKKSTICGMHTKKMKMTQIDHYLVVL